MQIKGLDDFKNLIATIKRDFPQETTQFLKMQAEELKGNVKKGTPVDTHLLQESWHRMKTGDFKQTIYNNVEYAAHVEYGHRNRGHKSYQLGRYMLTKAVKKQEDKFLKDLDYVFGKVLDK